MSTVDILKATQECTEPVRWKCSLGAYWRNQVNMIEKSMCGGDKTFCQITMTTC